MQLFSHTETRLKYLLHQNLLNNIEYRVYEFPQHSFKVFYMNIYQNTRSSKIYFDNYAQFPYIHNQNQGQKQRAQHKTKQKQCTLTVCFSLS